MGAIGDVFELVDEGTAQGQKVLNVYFYRQDVVSAGNVAEQLVDSWIVGVLPSVLAIQNDDILHTAVRARNLFNESEAHTELISEVGAAGVGSMLPLFNSVNFQLVGDNAAVRSGRKAFSAIDETAVEDGVITAVGFLTNLGILASALSADLAIGLEDNALQPVIVQRILDGLAYRLPVNAGEAVISQIIDALYNVEISSQLTRKIGKGE